MDNETSLEDSSKNEYEKKKNELELIKLEKEIEKLNNENLKIIEEKHKISVEALKIQAEKKEISKPWFLKNFTLETIGKIILGAGVMGFSYQLFVYPYFQTRELKLNMLTDSLKDQLTSKLGIISNLDSSIIIKEKKLKIYQTQSDSISDINNLLTIDNKQYLLNNKFLKKKGDTLTLGNKRQQLTELVVYYIFNDLEQKFDIFTLRYFDDNQKLFENTIHQAITNKDYRNVAIRIANDYYERAFRNLNVRILQLECIMENKKYEFNESVFINEKSIFANAEMDDFEAFVDYQKNLPKDVKDREIWNRLKINLIARLKTKLHDDKYKIRQHILKSNLNELKRIDKEINDLLPKKKSN